MEDFSWWEVVFLFFAGVIIIILIVGISITKWTEADFGGGEPNQHTVVVKIDNNELMCK